jgi:hypothetical protein
MVIINGLLLDSSFIYFSIEIYELESSLESSFPFSKKSKKGKEKTTLRDVPYRPAHAYSRL